MIDANSNCSRVDAVKARATQLKMQLDQAPRTEPENDTLRKAQSQVQALDTQVKAGDAKKAETALATAASAVQQLQTQNPGGDTSLKRGLDVYA